MSDFNSTSAPKYPPGSIGAMFPVVPQIVEQLTRERDEARAEVERLRARTHQIASEAEKRFAPYVSRCAQWDASIAAAREHFASYGYPAHEHTGGRSVTWWDMTSSLNRQAVTEIVTERDSLRGEVDRLNLALNGWEDDVQNLRARIESVEAERDSLRGAVQAVESPEAIEAAAIALYEDTRDPGYDGPEWDWPNIDRSYDKDDEDETDPEWLRNLYRREARVAILAALAAAADAPQPEDEVRCWAHEPSESCEDCEDDPLGPSPAVLPEKEQQR